MSAHQLCLLTNPPVRSPRLGRTSIRRHRRLRPQVAGLEDRTVLSSVQPVILSYPVGPIRGPAVVTVHVIDYPQGPIHGPAQAGGSASSFPTVPCYPNGPIRGPAHVSVQSSNYPSGPCLANGPCQVV
jgi:hypothetical protein